MISTIYIENDVADHPRTREIVRRFPQAVTIPCDRYGEILNRRAQNFRLQKLRPALVLARKFDNFILPSPEICGLNEKKSFYFSHMLNCIYDCRYCFLQGMYQSPALVIFVNFEDFQAAIEKKIREAAGEGLWFYSGYDCDSLAMEPVTGFAETFVPWFRRCPNAWLELRTKSVQIRSLLAMEAVPNCVVAFSFTPAEINETLEDKTPSVARRLEAMGQLQERGWNLGLHFDPLIYTVDYQDRYRRLFAEVFSRLCAENLHTVRLGPFRLPKPMFRTMEKLYPDEKLFAGPLQERKGVVSYRRDIEEEMNDFCSRELLKHIPEHVFYSHKVGALT